MKSERKNDNGNGNGGIPRQPLAYELGLVAGDFNRIAIRQKEIIVACAKVLLSAGILIDDDTRRDLKEHQQVCENQLDELRQVELPEERGLLISSLIEDDEDDYSQVTTNSEVDTEIASEKAKASDPVKEALESLLHCVRVMKVLLAEVQKDKAALQKDKTESAIELEQTTTV